MKIIIEIKNRKIKISLWEKGREKDFLDISDEYKLSEDLLPAIDELLKKNKLIAKDIKKVEVETDQDDNFTTTRLAKTVAETWNELGLVA
jgi:hypothetical protein